MKKIAEIFQQQKIFFNLHKTDNYHFRKRQLIKLKRILRQYENELLLALNKDLRKSKIEAFLTEFSLVYTEINYQIRTLKKNMSLKRKRTPIFLFKAKSYVKNDAYGQVLIVGPFNYPLQLVLMPLIAALATGNTVIVKPSEQSYYTSTLLQEMINTNFKSNYLYVTDFNGEKNDLAALLDLSFDFIFFTGSNRIGQIVLEKAAVNLTPVVLELGGKSPSIVDRDADIKMSAKRIVWGKLLNVGQTCIAPDYLLVHQAVKEQLVVELIKEIEKQYGTNAFFSPDYGRIINEKALARLIVYLQENEIIYGGKYDKNDLYFAPTLIEVTDLNSKIMQEEIFGPILPIITFTNLDDEIAKLKNKDKPLALYYFGKSINKIIKQTTSGGLVINDTLIHASNKYLPFGGVGQSGMGYYHGRASFEIFSHQKSIMKRSNIVEFSLRYAPFKNKIKLISKFFR